MNRRHLDKGLDETNATVPSDSADDAQIESNCSLELSLELEPSRTSVCNSWSFGSKLGKGFQNSERARREDSRHIYIAMVGRYFIFCNYPIFKIKDNSRKRLESLLLPGLHPPRWRSGPAPCAPPRLRALCAPRLAHNALSANDLWTRAPAHPATAHAQHPTLSTMEGKGRGKGAGRPPWSGEGAARGEGAGGGPPPRRDREGGGKREGLHGRNKNEELHGQQYRKGSPEKKPSPETMTNSPIEDEPSVGSTKRRHLDKALDETNAAVPSDSADDARIESNCSSELSSELEPSRTSASNYGSFRSKLGKGFRNSERARWEDSNHIYWLGQYPCVATGTYNISITYICTYVLYSYEIKDDIYELSEMTSKRNSGLWRTSTHLVYYIR
jgi:hypothetical protein